VPYVLLIQISTLPSVTFVPFTNNTSPLKHAERKRREILPIVRLHKYSYYKSFNGISM